jgi:hypothetical protein
MFDVESDSVEVIVSDFTYMIKRITGMPKSKRRSLMKHACDGYASANFGYEGYEGGKMLALDEGEHLLWLCHLLCESMGLMPFDHYPLEEIYTYPVSKGETPEERVKSLENRAVRSYQKIERYPSSGALSVAREVVQFYNSGKLLKFWKEVTQLLERKSVAELNA